MDDHDPRPRIEASSHGTFVIAAQCAVCGWCQHAPIACQRCGGKTTSAHVGPDGVVWSSTVVHIATSGRTPPYVLAYVDLANTLRILAHVDSTERVRAGTAVTLTGVTPGGDPLVALADECQV